MLGAVGKIIDEVEYYAGLTDKNSEVLTDVMEELVELSDHVLKINEDHTSGKRVISDRQAIVIKSQVFGDIAKIRKTIRTMKYHKDIWYK